MTIAKKMLLFFSIFLILGFAILLYMPREERLGDSDIRLRIGAGDDITGLLLKEIIGTSKEIKIENIYEADEGEGLFHDFIFKDCWSNTAQWALSSDEIDMAFYCNHMSLHLVRENDDFEIYGPIIMNAEVMAYRDSIEDIHRLGISYKREHLHNLARDNYKQIEEVIELAPTSLPYSLEGSQIDGAVLDITKAALLPKFNFAPLANDDYISYSLVVRKDIIGTQIFNEFIISYNRVIEKLNNPRQYIDMPEEFWKNVKIKFLSLE